MPIARTNTFRTLAGLASAALASVTLLGAGAGPAAAAGTGAQIVNIADGNVGKHYCDTNSAGGTGFASSCSASTVVNGVTYKGQFWCGDFVSWVWQQAGIPVPAANPASVPSWMTVAGYHPISSGYTPQPGDAVVFGDDQFPTQGSHIAIVTNYSNGLLSDVGGDEGGGGTPWWSTSSVHVDEGNGAAWNPNTKLFAGTGSEMWVLGYVSSGAGQGTTSPASSFRVTSSITGMKDGSSQVLAMSADGTLWFNSRSSSGAWAGWGTIAGGNGTPFVAKGATIAGIPDGSGSSQILAVGTDGVIYHNVRSSNGVWQGFHALTGGNGAPWQTTTTPSITGLPDGSSQIVVTSTDGTLWHNIRSSSGVWAGWGTIAGGNGTPFVAKGATIGGLTDGSGSSQILAVGTDGVIYHDVRSNGTWQGFHALTGGNGAPWQAA